ncbi:hypothetical protein [Deinococcus hopiensis]|uniref:Tetratricopeptide repeat-containing protein n=1 Tax=Deinococcus hopiensis KR-140 TaxID=695939 RepID=A0A1W1VWN8_9DEIO|nr:hypothetical protein [Deinococcus hopiensis]SMB97521.1 hypothetical protein SAMN00790413_06017 [Deinococcus hopiensis KR-140]
MTRGLGQPEEARVDLEAALTTGCETGDHRLVDHCLHHRVGDQPGAYGQAHLALRDPAATGLFGEAGAVREERPFPIWLARICARCGPAA